MRWSLQCRRCRTSAEQAAYCSGQTLASMQLYTLLPSVRRHAHAFVLVQNTHREKPIRYSFEAHGVNSACIFTLRRRDCRRIHAVSAMPPGGSGVPTHLQCPACDRNISEEVQGDQLVFEESGLQTTWQQRMRCQWVASCLQGSWRLPRVAA
jgi:hypothetical protein